MYSSIPNDKLFNAINRHPLLRFLQITPLIAPNHVYFYVAHFKVHFFVPGFGNPRGWVLRTGSSDTGRFSGPYSAIRFASSLLPPLERLVWTARLEEYQAHKRQHASS